MFHDSLSFLGLNAGNFGVSLRGGADVEWTNILELRTLFEKRKETGIPRLSFFLFDGFKAVLFLRWSIYYTGACSKAPDKGLQTNWSRSTFQFCYHIWCTLFRPSRDHSMILEWSGRWETWRHNATTYIWKFRDGDHIVFDHSIHVCYISRSHVSNGESKEQGEHFWCTTESSGYDAVY